MAEPFIGEIKIVGYTFAPRGWAFCDGQILPIAQNQSLYSLLGTTYGGNGRTDFGLPDLRGRAPVHVGTGTGLPAVSWGQKGGQETVTLSVAEMPAHSHTFQASNHAPNRESPQDNYLAASAHNAYSGASPDANMNVGILANTGGQQPHSNMQPYLALNFVIALVGLFPSRN